MDFYEAFLDHMNEQQQQGRKIVVCGDLNTAHHEIDLAHPKENEKVSGFLPEEREWIDRFLQSGFTDTFRIFNDHPEQYTWWDMRTRARDRNVGWRIDYFYVSENLREAVSSATILADVQGSDHCPIDITLSL
jgi:exodeoxyribonuclease-3